MEELWADGSLCFWVGSYAEVLSDEEANREFYERRISKLKRWLPSITSLRIR